MIRWHTFLCVITFFFYYYWTPKAICKKIRRDWDLYIQKLEYLFSCQDLVKCWVSLGRSGGFVITFLVPPSLQMPLAVAALTLHLLECCLECKDYFTFLLSFSAFLCCAGSPFIPSPHDLINSEILNYVEFYKPCGFSCNKNRQIMVNKWAWLYSSKTSFTKQAMARLGPWAIVCWPLF